LIQPLLVKLTDSIAQVKQDYEKKLQNKIKAVVDTAKGAPKENSSPWNKVTIQADKGMDFLTVKKVMYTVTEAGAGEINFAVMKTVTPDPNKPPQ
jgi:biopolymer transport protein ExbD